jgi:hypothetical protein
VDGQALDAQEILAVGDADGERDLVCHYRRGQNHALDIAGVKKGDSQVMGQLEEPPLKVGPVIVVSEMSSDVAEMQLAHPYP